MSKASTPAGYGTTRHATDGTSTSSAPRCVPPSARCPPNASRLVTDHHVFGYLAQRFGFTVVGAVIPGGSTLASPSASDLKSLADAIRAADVPAVFTGAAQPDRLARVLRDETGLGVSVVPLYTESLTGPDGGAPTYLAMMRANTRAITAALTSR